MTSKLDPPRPDEREELQRQIDELRRNLHRLRLENDLLNKANELIKKDGGINLQSLSNREKTQLVDALKQIYPVLELPETLGLARSSYFYHRAQAQVADKYSQVRGTMADIFERNHRCYGYRRERAQQALSEAETARAAIDRQRRELETSVAETYADATGNVTRWRLSEQGASAASENARLTQRAYALGEADLQALLLARRQFLEASRAALDARAEALRANYRLLIDAHLIWDLSLE